MSCTAEQHIDREEGVFFQRVEFDLSTPTLDRAEVAAAFQPVAARFGMDVTVRFSHERPRIALLASRRRTASATCSALALG